jgi:nitrogenase molybdenum-iron protein alpha chain
MRHHQHLHLFRQLDLRPVRLGQQADLSCVMCHRSINYVADMLETKYGIPWIKVNFIGAEATAKSLRKIAEYFGDQELTARVEAVIAEEMPAVTAVPRGLPRTKGKTAMLFVGGSRAHHYQELFAEMGMKTLAAGYEFAHRDDYEGRQVIPNLKVDADSRNIEEIEVEADPRSTNRARPEEMAKALKRKAQVQGIRRPQPGHGQGARWSSTTSISTRPKSWSN